MRRREQKQARQLRREEKSLRQIATELDVAVSSVSVWTRDITEQLCEQGNEETRSRSAPVVHAGQASTERRECSRCRRVLGLAQFNRLGSGLQAWCRECFASYFRHRGAKHVSQTKESQLRRRAAAKTYRKAYVANRACGDCDTTDHRVLEFDHVAEKRANISALISSGPS